MQSSRPGNIVKRLLIKGAELTLEDKRGRSPIDVCRSLAATPENQPLIETLGVLERADDRTKGFC